MEKTKILGLSVVALFVLNFILMAFLFFGKPGHRMNRQRPREVVIERLHFNEQQRKEYDALIRIDRQNVSQLESKINQAKNKLYLLLQQENPRKNGKDSLIALLGKYQLEVENTHFEHFEHIKKLCRKDQIPDFNLLTQELSQIFSHPPPPAQ